MINTTPTHFEIDSIMGNVFQGYKTLGSSQWNGFAIPYFTKRVAETILATMVKAGTIKRWHYDPKQDAFIVADIYDDDYTYTTYKGVATINQDGHLIMVYSIGGYEWVWSERTDKQN